MSLVIARNELRRLFVQPLAWALLAAVLGVLAYFFLLTLQGYLVLMPKIAGNALAPGVTDLVALPLTRAIASVLLLIVPLLGMRAFAGDRTALPLLLTSGLSDTRVVFGKYIGLVTFFALLIVIALVMPLSLEIGTALDLGRIAASAFGLVLLAGTLAALALWASALAQQPAVAAGLALVLNLLLWMLDAGARYEGVTSEFVNYLALPTHLEPFLHGIVATVDVVYFVLLSMVALALATRRLSASRVRG
jgi:ABC-2 type transport system permease protein